jgi:hypothetical protein
MRETKKHWVWRILAILGIWGIGAAGCTDDGTDNNNGDNGKDTSTETEGEDTGTGEDLPEASCADGNDRLKECGFFDSGAFGCTEATEFSKCELACAMVVSCDTLISYHCAETDEELLSAAEDFADECPVDCFTMIFTCDDGEEIPAAYECDGASDCGDESDEHSGCGIFTCEDGMEIMGNFECDGYFDCDDGSDEHDGCATLSCP